MKIFRLIIILFFLSNSNAFAQYKELLKSNQNALGMQNALQELMLKQGNVTRQDYDNFWNKLGINSRQEKEMTINSIKKNFLLIQEYNREMWSCAQTAWYTSKIPDCPKAQERLTTLKKNSKMKEQAELFKIIEENFDNILKASANKTEIKGKNGANYGKISLEIIISSKDNIDKILNRFNQVLVTDFVENKK